MKKKKFTLGTLAIILLVICCIGNLFLAHSGFIIGMSAFRITLWGIEALLDALLVAVLIMIDREYGR